MFSMPKNLWVNMSLKANPVASTLSISKTARIVSVSRCPLSERMFKKKVFYVHAGTHWANTYLKTNPGGVNTDVYIYIYICHRTY